MMKNLSKITNAVLLIVLLAQMLRIAFTDYQPDIASVYSLVAFCAIPVIVKNLKS